MKAHLPFTFILAFFSLLSYGQFNQKSYTNFRETVKDLTFNELNELNSNQDQKYYRGYNLTPNASEIVYLDSVILKLKLTKEEQDLLMQNHFVVTERLNSNSFGGAYQTNVFNKDLPVFVSTDLILHALHTSYDNILKGAEGLLMMPNIKEYIADLHNNLPAIAHECFCIYSE